jgi:hypothetical protein
MTQPANPLLEKLKLPGRIFELPSRGLFYTNGELAGGAEIHVHALSAMDEINLKNPDQLFSGKAVEAVLPSCVDGVLKPNQLLAKDVDAIMLFLRTVTYGPALELRARHTCENAKEHSYTLNVDEIIADMKPIDPTTVEASFTVTMPNGQVVKLRPSRYSNMVELIKENTNKKTFSVEDQKHNLLRMLLDLIKSVDGIEDEKLISEWLQQVQTTWVSQITQQIEKAHAWGPDLSRKVKCKDCGEEFTIDVPINPISFFTE